MNWAYGITTVSSRYNGLLPGTVASLAKAGFPNPVLFIDGMDPKWKSPSNNLKGIVMREPAVGHLTNWILSFTYLYNMFPQADRYALFEDDLIATKNLREYLERCPYPPKGYLNLISHPENLVKTGGVEGWHLSNQKGRGAVGLVFNQDAAFALLKSPIFFHRNHTNNPKCADGAIMDAMAPLGFKEYIHYPTLLQHKGGGDKSSMGHPYGEMLGWRGEEYDVLELLPEIEEPVVIDRQAEIDKARNEAFSKLIPPRDPRLSVWRGGVLQIHVTRACDMACYGCTQGSNLAGKPYMITLEEFDLACRSLRDYWGVVGIFGGNPATHPKFEELCKILRKYFPQEQCGLWCNHPRGKGKIMRETFNHSISNLNVHLSREAYDEFKKDWPECSPFGLDIDSRHSPPFVAMKDVIEDEAKRWELIGNCDINKLWSAMVCAVPGKGVRGFFCEIAGAQSIIHANDPDWPDTGIPITEKSVTSGQPLWWQLHISKFAKQVIWNCHNCGVPLRRYGQLAVKGEYEEVSKSHENVYIPKRNGRTVQLVQLDEGPKLDRVTDYVKNANVPNKVGQ